jgi:hypothetical protein
MPFKPVETTSTALVILYIQETGGSQMGSRLRSKVAVVISVVSVLNVSCASVYRLSCEESCSLHGMTCSGLSTGKSSIDATTFGPNGTSFSTYGSSSSTSFSCNRAESYEVSTVSSYRSVAEKKAAYNSYAESANVGWGIAWTAYGVSAGAGLMIGAPEYLVPLVGPLVRMPNIPDTNSTARTTATASFVLQAGGLIWALIAQNKADKVISNSAFNSKQIQIVPVATANAGGAAFRMSF